MSHAHHHHDDHQHVGGKAIDPVCGMTVDPHNAKHRADHQGHPYYFCSAGCKTKFTADP
ncbi:MAG: YHS domain-containing protein, partial [Pseudolabrys sp.]